MSERAKNLNDYLTVGEAAAVLGVSPSTLRNWDSSGKVRARRHPVNGYRLYRASDLSRLLLDVQAEPEQKPTVQRGLFGDEPADSTPSDVAEAPAFSDPAFAANKSAPVHRWVPWIAGFSGEFVRNAMERYLGSGRGKTVLDPFAGVGTTLVEALLQGHHAMGFEINPYAALACRVKATCYELDPGEVRQTVGGLMEFYRDSLRRGHAARSIPPAGFKTRGQFYSPEVLRKVLLVQDFINDLTEPKQRDLFRLAFASSMVTYSNYSYEPSLGRRVSAGKRDFEDYPVGPEIETKLLAMADDIEWVRVRLGSFRPSVEVFNQSFFTAHDRLLSGSVDLLVTSPPYLNNYHYNRNTRPHLYWLGFVEKPADMKPLEEMNFGKFWQTVRASERVDLQFSSADELSECLELLRSKTPEKGVYGGNGWANYAASYFNDCRRFAENAWHCLRPGGTALVVIGNSILQGVMIPTDRFLANIARGVGLEVVDIHVPRATRVGNSIIQSDVRVKKAEDWHQLYEAVVELRRP